MNGTKLGIWIAVLLASATGFEPASGYPVAGALSLDEMFGQADLVCKAEVVSTAAVEDAWFEKQPGFEPRETRLKIVAVYKGRTESKEVAFRHYGPPNEAMGYHFMPQYYDLKPRRTYVIFAAATADKGVFRQLWKNHRSQEDQGVVLAASGEAHADQPIKEVIWRELSGLLKSKSSPDVLYGLAHLDALSGGSYDKLHDFEREEVLDEVKRLLGHADPAVAQAAVSAMGSRNPYLSPDYGAGWLATFGAGHIPGFASWEDQENLGGKLYWQQLTAVVDSTAPVEQRALAIRALGRAGEPLILPLVLRWTKDPEPAVRQAAAVLLADFKGEFDPKLLESLASDPQPAVRSGAAQAIGFGQFAQLVPVLGKLLADKDAEVEKSAALSLLSFSLDQSREVLEANLKHPQYHPLFVNALARQDAEPYVDQLADIVRTKRQPAHWWGGHVTWGVSWEILFFHAQSRPVADLKAGRCDRLLDALEYPASGDRKGPSYYSSSEPRDLYALYVQRGLVDRAAKFRAQCRKTITYDIDYYFKMVDDKPADYQRR